MTTKKTDPIKRVELGDGRVRYRFVVDMDRKQKEDKRGKPILDEDGAPIMVRDQRTFTYDTLKEARAERARMISERSQGTLIKPNRKYTVGQAVTEFLEIKAGKKPSTRQSYYDALAPLVGRHAGLPLQALDVPHMEALKRDMRSGKLRRLGPAGKPLSPRTVNLALGVTSMMLKWAIGRRLIHVNVAELVERVEADQDAGVDRGEWQTADAVAFLRFVAGDRLYAAWFLTLLGLRRGEVLGLRWDDVDLTGELARSRKLPDGTPSIGVVNNRITVKGKIIEGTPKGKGRRKVTYLPIPEVLVAALKRLKAKQAAERLAAGEAYGACPLCGGAHVVADELGAPFRPARYSKRFEALVKAAGLPPLVLHGGRHCAASVLGDMGYPDVVLAAWLGHTQVTITHGYQHAMAERMREAGQALGEALAG